MERICRKKEGFKSGMKERVGDEELIIICYWQCHARYAPRIGVLCCVCTASVAYQLHTDVSIGNESVPNIIVNDTTTFFFLNYHHHFRNFEPQ